MGNKESREDQQESEKEIFIHRFSEDLLSNQVDGIVCFTDRKWSTDNLSCHLLAKHGGNHYTSERHAIKQDNKDCPSGDVYVGAGGMLPCKKVLFCVASENEVELTEGSEQLYDHEEVTMVTNMLEKATREEFFSMAIIIGGNDAGPDPTCLIPLIYCKFLMLTSSLQEIHLVSLDESLIDIMQKVLRESHQLSVVDKQSMPSDHHQGGPRNLPPPDSNENVSEATPNQKSSTQGQENPSVSEETLSTTQPASADNPNDDDDDVVEDSYMNNIMGMKDVKIQPPCSDHDGPKVQADDTDLGAVGGSVQPGVVTEFVQHYGSSDEDYDDDDGFKKTMFSRGESTASTASQEDNLDFVNILKPVGGTKQGKRLIVDPGSSHSSTKDTKEDKLSIVDPRSPHSPAKGFVCSICMEEKTLLSLKKLEKCGHQFCTECIGKHLQVHGTCPLCKCRYSDACGNQPDGIMSYYTTKESVAGYEGIGTIVIEYDIPNGIQTENHPNPGQNYKGLHRSAFLPDNPDGQRILALLLKAFDKKLVFTVGTSITTGRENVTTWNDIHHKTRPNGGPNRFGYPDPTYLRRVFDELIAKGVTEDD